MPILKVRNVNTGLVFERNSVDARDMLATGQFVHAEEGEYTIRERLHALSSRDREGFTALVHSAFGSNTHPNEKDAHFIDKLVPLLETGRLAFPDGVPTQAKKKADAA